jgi:hypothetical protein
MPGWDLKSSHQEFEKSKTDGSCLGGDPGGLERLNPRGLHSSPGARWLGRVSAFAAEMNRNQRDENERFAASTSLADRRRVN